MFVHIFVHTKSPFFCITSQKLIVNSVRNSFHPSTCTPLRIYIPLPPDTSCGITLEPDIFCHLFKALNISDTTVWPDFISVGQSVPASSRSRSISLPVLSRQKYRFDGLPLLKQHRRYSPTTIVSNKAGRAGWMASCCGV